MRRLLLAAVVTLALAPVAHGASPQAAFGLRAAGNPKPGYFVYSTGAGTVEHGTVLVSNSGTLRGTARLYTADTGTGTTTGTVYLTDRAPKETGAWISLGRRTLTLAPGATARVPFTVHVPADTAAGQYIAGIVAESLAKQAGGSGGGGKTSVHIRIRNLSIMAVQVNVPGPTVHRFTIGKVTAGGEHGFQQVILEVANRGNVLEHPTGTVSISEASGRPVEVLAFHMDTFLPHTSIDYPVELRKALPAGAYRAAVTLHYAAGARLVAARPTFTVTPAELEKAFTTTALPPPASPVTAPAAPAAASSSGDGGGAGPWLWIVVGGIAAALVLGIALFAWRRRGPDVLVTLPAPMPPPPSTAAPSPRPQPPVTAEPEPAPEPAPEADAAPTCVPYHYWNVDYEAGELGDDGAWRFPHRCRSCGLELMARDVTDASDQAAART